MAAGFAFVLVDKSTSASPLKAQLTPEFLQKVADTCALQLNRDSSPYWAGAFSGRVAANAQDVKPDELEFDIVDALPDAPGAEAYHAATGADLPDAFLALSTCSTLDDVSTGISHELLEIQGDPGCNRWCDDFAGKEHAQELCDAVQANSYKIGDVAVSDFLLPAWFQGPAAQGPYSFCQATGQGSGTTNAPSAPAATTQGGYQLERTSATDEAQVTGELGPRAAKAKHWSSRAAKRGYKAPAEAA
jgi:hypothetical protein